jgi:hypothetical protein
MGQRRTPRPPPGPLLCPSAPPRAEDGFAFGVVGGTTSAPRVGYLTSTLPVTPELLEATAPARPTEVLRFAAPCAAAACRHFDGTDCTLAARVVQLLPLVAGELPACVIRSSCRWWHQEGKSACMRCPGVVTESYAATEAHRRAADPSELWGR